MVVTQKTEKLLCSCQEKLIEKNGHQNWVLGEAAEAELGPKKTGFSHAEKGVPARWEEGWN